MAYLLATPNIDGAEPRWVAAGERFAVSAVGLSGPVVVRIRPVPPGTYRIARDYVRGIDHDLTTTVAAVESTVT